MFQFFKTLFQQRSQIFTKFAILEPRFTKISVPKPQIWQNFSSKASNWHKIQFFKPLFFPKNQFFKPLFFVPGRSLSPHLRPFGATHIYQNESSVTSQEYASSAVRYMLRRTVERNWVIKISPCSPGSGSLLTYKMVGQCILVSSLDEIES